MSKIGSKIKLLIVDDHEIVRKGLRAIFNLENGFEIVGEARDGVEAVKKTKDFMPDIVLMDLRLPEMDGIAAAQRIKSFAPQIQILALTSFDEDEEIIHAIKAGVSGYLLKDALPEDLIKAVYEIHKGHSLLDPTVTRKLLNQLSLVFQDYTDKGGEKLSPREVEVLELIARGFSNKEIAAELWISEKTVKTHVSSILHKLKQPSRAQAVLYAYREGLLGIDKEISERYQKEVKPEREDRPTQNTPKD